MAKKTTRSKKNTGNEPEEFDETIGVVDEPDVDISEDVEDPIDDVLLDPKIAKDIPAEGTEDSEEILYCPNCGLGIFVDNVCTNCGQKRNMKKNYHSHNDDDNMAFSAEDLSLDEY